MKPTGTDDKPPTEKASLQQLLSAAFVVQQHNERLQSGQPAESGYSQTLKAILEVQEQLRDSQLDLSERMALIARRLRQMTQASGSAIALLSGSQLEYYAATGSAASEAGASMPQEAGLAYECLRTGQLLESQATDSDPRLNHELCRTLGVKALIAIPVKLEGSVAGVLELHFAEPNAFHEQEVRTCQLVSALVADAILKPLSHPPETAAPTRPWPSTAAQPAASSIGTSAAAGPSRATAKDTEALLAALEKIRPKLEHLTRNAGSSLNPRSTQPSTDISETPLTTPCRNCGHAMSAEEAFCGGCGKPRQSHQVWSSLWDLQRKSEDSVRQNPGPVPTGDGFDDPLDVFPSELEEIVSKFSGEAFGDSPAAHSEEVSLPSFAEELTSNKTARRETKHDTKQETKPETKAEAQKPDWLLEPKQEGSLPVSKSSAPVQPQSSPDHHDSGDASSDAGRPFLIEKSSENPPPPTELYPSFSGFASDTSLLSLPSELEQESIADSHIADNHITDDHDDPLAPWSPDDNADDHDDSKQTSPKDPGLPWGSAAKTKEWLEVQDDRSWLARAWQQQRAHVYLMAAGVLFLAVLLSWLTPSKPLASRNKATGMADGVGRSGNNGQHDDSPPDADLSLSEKLLVSLGLAEVPPVQAADPGNPGTKVWIDVHTALYYCPGADLFGKTAGGRTTTQREAQMDQFQPAMRKACN